VTISGGTIPRWRSRRVFVWNGGSVEAEENRPEVGFRPFGGVWLELRLDVDDEGGADCGEQTGLRNGGQRCWIAIRG
jgi:hypothetical protein